MEARWEKNNKSKNIYSIVKILLIIEITLKQSLSQVSNLVTIITRKVILASTKNIV